jgi:hypothetical protein
MSVYSLYSSNADNEIFLYDVVAFFLDKCFSSSISSTWPLNAVIAFIVAFFASSGENMSFLS